MVVLPRLLLWLLLFLGMFRPEPLFGHLALSGSTPAAGSVEATSPREIRLSFTESVELALSSIRLSGPTGEIVLGNLGAANAGRELAAPLLADLAPGHYTVQWQAVGADGHPVRGEYTFDLAGPPILEVSPEIPPSSSVVSQPGTGDAAFSAQSPLYAGVRWLIYTALLAIIGVATFAVMMTSLARPGGALSSELTEALTRRASSLGLTSASILLLADVARLQAQSHAVFGQGLSRARFTLLMQSGWGMSYLAQVGAAVLTICGVILWRRKAAAGAGMGVTFVSALLLSVATTMGGHAAADGGNAGTVLADALHIFSAGAWLGTLLVLLTVVLPQIAMAPDEDRPALLRILLDSFSTIALLAGGLVVATGLFGALAQLSQISDLWTTPYGRVLDLKLFFVLIVFIAGGLNWRRFQRSAFPPGSEAQLRRRGTMEIAAAALVIGLTSLLVAIPPPAHQPSTNVPPPVASR